MLRFQDIAKITVEVIKDSRDDEFNVPELDDETDEKAIRQKLIKGHINDMIDNSSFHGLGHIFDKKRPLCRTIWFVITVAALGYSIHKVYESTVNYFDYPFHTAIMRKYVDKIDFPAVSFCNLNDMRLSIINGTSLDAQLLNITTDNITDINITREDPLTFPKKAAHRIEEMLVDCKFNGEQCSSLNFSKFYWWQGDTCFTFNSGKQNNSRIHYVSGSGVKKSLILTINIQHYDYYRDRMNAGVRLILHGQDATPVKMNGAMISPGYTAHVKVEKRKIINLESPYKTQCGSRDLKYFNIYSMDTCWLEHLTNHVVHICGCKDFFMPGDTPICNLTQAMNCMWREWGDFDAKKQHKPNCPVPCKIDSFGQSLSRSLFPSTFYTKILEDKLQKQKHMEGQKITQQFLRDNLLRIIIYYDDLSYEHLEQRASYDTLVWLGDIGGQIGLFVGAGAMSYFELIDCLCLVIYSRFFEKIKPTTEL